MDLRWIHGELYYIASQVTHDEAVSTAVTNLGLSDRTGSLPPAAESGDTSDAGGALGRALLLHAATGRIGAAETTSWLRRLTAQSNRVDSVKQALYVTLKASRSLYKTCISGSCEPLWASLHQLYALPLT